MRRCNYKWSIEKFAASMSLNIHSTSALLIVLAAGRSESTTKEVVFIGGEGNASGEWVAEVTIDIVECSFAVDFPKRGQPVNVLSRGAIYQILLE